MSKVGMVSDSASAMASEINGVNGLLKHSLSSPTV